MLMEGAVCTVCFKSSATISAVTFSLLPSKARTKEHECQMMDRAIRNLHRVIKVDSWYIEHRE